MKVENEEAKHYNAVRLDNFNLANKGVLTLADDQTGEVHYTDQAGETKTMTLGAHAIRILHK
jgi:hypothetical protein